MPLGFALLLACGSSAAEPTAEASPTLSAPPPSAATAAPSIERARLFLDADRRFLSEVILTGLQHPDAATRHAATLALARSRRPEAVDRLLLGLRDTDSSVRTAASLGLGALESEAPPAVQAALLAALAAEREPLVRAAMTRDLGRLGSSAALPAVAAALGAEDAAERAAGCIAAAELGLTDGISLPVELRSRLAALIGSEEPDEVRIACVSALSRLSARHVEHSPGEMVALTLATADRHPEVRALAHRALAFHPVALANLVHGTRDADWRVAVQAFRALARRAAAEPRGPTIYAEALKEAHRRYAASPGPGGPLHVLSSALEAAAPIARARAIHDAAAEIHDALGALPESEPPTRERALAHCAAAELLDRARGWPSRIDDCGFEQVLPAERLARSAAMLGELEGAESPRVALLGRLLSNREPAVRQAALSALASIWEPKATELVLSALSDVDPGVLSVALDALSRTARRAPTDARVPPPLPATRALAALRAVPEAWSEDALEARLRWLDAVEALDARELVPTVRALARHPSEAPRRRARALLESWREPLPELPGPGEPTLEPEAILPSDARPRVRFETDRGPIVVALRPDHAPATVAHFLGLVRAGFYDGLSFHRVVPGFVVQGGDPRGDGHGGPGRWIRCEDNRLAYVPGTLGMALAGRDTGGSQFFFVLAAQPHLEGRYTAFGQVVEGLERLERIHPGDRIRSARVETSSE